MIKKKILLLLIFFSLASCGYNPIYSNKSFSNFSVSKFETSGDAKINRKIRSLLNIKEDNNLENSYTLSIISKKDKVIVAKDKLGNVSIFKITAQVFVTIFDSLDPENIIKTKEFNSTYSYNNIKNKFDLSQKEKDIENNLIESIAQEIIIFLHS